VSVIAEYPPAVPNEDDSLPNIEVCGAHSGVTVARAYDRSNQNISNQNISLTSFLNALNCASAWAATLLWKRHMSCDSLNLRNYQETAAGNSSDEREKAMIKHTAVFAVAVILALGVLGLDAPNKPAPMVGAWQVDTRHSDVKLITDATTDYGKTKINLALGFARVNGRVTIDDADPTKSSVEFRFYPATSMAPSIDEDGKFLSHWLENMSNHTLVCFHSKRVVRTPDGRLQATGELAVTRVDRNVEANPSEAYAGPVYGPPMIHRVSREATFVFDFPATNGNSQKESFIQASGSTSVFREDFPQLVKTVVNTYWPTVIQDENCQVPDASEAYSGSQCTGTYLSTAGFPEAPYEGGGEGVGVPQNFNAIVGNHLTILVHMRLMAKAPGEKAATGD
jgi:polyisoprenoid-binding protein YceI